MFTSISALIRQRASHLLFLSLLAGLSQYGFAAETDTFTMLTDEQRRVELLALKLFNSPEIKKQREETYKRWGTDPAANTSSGKKTLRNGVDELAFYACLNAANASDPAHPHLSWYFTAPHSWLGPKTPGSRIGIENPDNLYQQAMLDSASQYEITVKPRRQPGPIQYSFQTYDSYWQNTKQGALLDKPIATLLDKDIKTEADGSFTITLDSSPANGRPNHLQSTPDLSYVLVRQTLNDWGRQNPMEIKIRRVGGPEASAPLGERESARYAAHILKLGGEMLMNLKRDGYHFDNGKPNVIPQPFGRGGNWGYFDFANFKLMDDEAFVVTLDPMGAKYLGFVLVTPWMVSREHIRASGSLNNTQAQPNKDGTYTYVISAKDPGVQNWLDTGGLHDGAYMIRWQGFSDSVKSIDTAIREQKVVKLSELPKILPPDTTRVSPEQRKEINAKRAEAYARRAGAGAPVVYESIRQTPREP